MASWLMVLQCVKSLSRVRLFVTLWTGVCQAPLSMGFFRQEYWSGLPFPSPVISGFLVDGFTIRDIKRRSHYTWNTSVLAQPKRTMRMIASAFFKCLTYSRPHLGPFFGPSQNSRKVHFISQCKMSDITLILWKPMTLGKIKYLGLPWWLSVKESACQCRRPGCHP